MNEDQVIAGTDAIELATELTIAWLSNPNVQVSAADVPAFLQTIHGTLNELAKGASAADAEKPVYMPAVPVRSSVKPEYLVSLIDGRKFKSLKRHLTINGLTPAEYRDRYGLKPDYPMVAPSYSQRRREVAQKLGLGRKRAVPAPVVADAKKPEESKPAQPVARAKRTLKLKI